MKLSSDSEAVRKILSIAARLRKNGVKISTMEIEAAIKLYRSAVLLSGYNYYPLMKVIEAIFIKREYDAQKLEEAFRYIHASSKPYGRERSDKDSRAEAREVKTIKRGERRKTRRARELELLKRYLETENTGYLDMLRDEYQMKSEQMSKVRTGGDVSLDRLISKFVMNPADHSSLMRIAIREGGDIAVLAMRYLASRRNRRAAEQIAYKLTRHSRGRNKLMKGGKWEKTYFRERMDLRRTLFFKSRGKIAEIAYKRRRKRIGEVLVIDRSDSMRKYAEKVAEIASSHINYADYLVFFSDEVEIIPITRWKSRLFLLDRVLDLSFHGYTNIALALRRVRNSVRPGSAITLISDLQQTVKDSSPIELLDRLSRSGYNITLYTTADMCSLLEGKLGGNVRLISFT